MFTPSPTLSEQFSEIIDRAAITKNSKKETRNYLGVSRWGEECERRLFFEYNKYPTDTENQFTGKTLRIFDMGNDGESRVEQYLRDSGFKIRSLKEDNFQYGFSLCHGRLSGHIDGFIDAGPLHLPYPLIWENKALGSKSFSKMKNHGLKQANIVYYTQINAYMSYLECEHGFFTALNRDTGELYAELIPFDAACAQFASDKAVRVIEAKQPEDVPRCTNDPCDFKCTFCPYKEKTCWKNQNESEPVKNITPSWLI